MDGFARQYLERLSPAGHDELVIPVAAQVHELVGVSAQKMVVEFARQRQRQEGYE